jgi:hypothetical protein
MDTGISPELQYAAKLQSVGSGLENACLEERLPTSQTLMAIFGSAPLPSLTSNGSWDALGSGHSDSLCFFWDLSPCFQACAY